MFGIVAQMNADENTDVEHRKVSTYNVGTIFRKQLGG
jgi:hypothetical protein